MCCLVTVMLGLVASCSKPANVADNNSAAPTVASLVPAATDLIVGMGARDRLVAVSSYDDKRPDVRQLPRAGNYETIDWELLRSLHPTVLITQTRPIASQPALRPMPLNSVLLP